MDRREFVIAGAAASLAQQVQAQDLKEIRVAHIGIGNRGTSLVKQVLAQPRARITAICDIDAGKRDAAQSLAKRDNPKSFTDYRQVLDLSDVDAVAIATPCYLHAEMAAAALDAGKWVYCEKPVGITPEQVDSVLKAQKRAKTYLQIGQQLRYFPTMREALRQIQEVKAIGTPFVIKAQRHSTPPEPGKERPRPEWYIDVKRSGDLIVENAVHNIDVCNWIAGAHPESAYGFGKKYLPTPIPAGTKMMDGFIVNYIYPNDVQCDYSQLYLHPRQMKELKNNQWYIVFGDKGSMEVDDGMLYPMYGAPQKIFTPELEKKEENAMAEFMRCIREKERPYADIKVAATAALTAIMGREAIYKRGMVTWKELGVEV